MSRFAPSIDVAVHTLRSRKAAIEQLLVQFPDDGPVRHFLADIAKHYDEGLDAIASGQHIHSAQLTAAGCYVAAMQSGRYACATAYADIAHALGAEVEYV